MRFLLIDPIDFSYGPRTPFERPLGGMQSSIVYIAKAISEAGHSVVVLNNIEAPETDGNVMYVPLPKDGDAFIALGQRIAPDVGIVLGGSDALFAAKHNLPEIPWMFWTGHAYMTKTITAHLVTLQGSHLTFATCLSQNGSRRSSLSGLVCPKNTAL